MKNIADDLREEDVREYHFLTLEDACVLRNPYEYKGAILVGKQVKCEGGLPVEEVFEIVIDDTGPGLIQRFRRPTGFGSRREDSR